MCAVYDAWYYSAEEAADRFVVPTVIWDELRLPQTKIIVGGQGTGKTMLLKRLSWPAMLRRKDFLPNQEFLGFYCDLRQLAELEPITTTAVLSPDQALDIASYYTNLVLLRSMLETLEEVGSQTGSEVQAAFRLALQDFAASFQEPSLSQSDPSQLLLAVSRKVADFVDVACSPTQLRSFVSSLRGAPKPEFALRSLVTRLAAERTVGRIGFLMDQYEHLPERVRPLINGLLRRENHGHFFTVFASRPLFFTRDLHGGSLQSGEDFSTLLVEYLSDNADLYRDLLEDIWARLRPEARRLSWLLQGGPDYFMSMSSRSVRLFLKLCEGSGAMAAGRNSIVPATAQRNAANHLSRTLRDALRSVSPGRGPTVWELIKMLTETSAARGMSRASVAGRVAFADEDLHGIEAISDKGRELIKAAFGESALQFSTVDDGSHHSTPARGLLAPILGPALGGTVNQAKQVSIDREAIEGLFRYQVGKKDEVPLSRSSLRSIFLSVPFSEVPALGLGRQLIAEVFSETAIRVVEGKAFGDRSQSQIREQIRRSQIALVELGQLKPNVLCELGIVMALRKPYIPILNLDAGKLPPLRDYPFLAEMGHFPYHVSRQKVAELREAVLDWVEREAEGFSVLDSGPSGKPLRVKADSRTVCIYYPEVSEAVWSTVVPVISERLTSRGYRVLFPGRKPYERGLLRLQESLVWSISSSATVFVDTTGVDSPDLYGAFALGLAYGMTDPRLRRKVVRLEQEGVSYEGGLFMVPETDFQRWRSVKALIEMFEVELPLLKARRRRQK